MISKPLPAKDFAKLVSPETLAAELAAEPDTNVRTKAAGILFWDLCERRPEHAAAISNHRQKYPVESCDQISLRKLLRRCGYSVRWAAARSVLAKIKGRGSINPKKVRNPPRRKNEK